MNKSNKFKFALLISAIISGCANEYDDEATQLIKCGISAQILGKEEIFMLEASKWRATQIKQVELDAGRLKHYKRITSDAANSDGSPNKEKVLSWYSSDYCRKLSSDYATYKSKLTSNPSSEK